MRAIYLLSIWLHIMAAIVWIGSMMFLVLVLVPVARKPGSGLNIMALVRATGSRFRGVSWAALLLLLVTGLVNLHFRGALGADEVSLAYWRTSVGTVLAWKILLAGVVFILSAVHDFVVGPKARRLWETAPDSRSAAVTRKAAAWMGRVNVVLALIIVALAIMVVRGTLW